MRKLTDAEIDAALALCGKATRLPWRVVEKPDRLIMEFGPTDNPDALLYDGNCYEEDVITLNTPDWHFIAAARALLPRALAELQEMRKPCVWTNDGFGWWKAPCGGMECCLTQNPFDAGRKYCPSCGHPVKVEDKQDAP